MECRGIIRPPAWSNRAVSAQGQQIRLIARALLRNERTIRLYRYSRNPMYVAVAVMLFGWALTFGSMNLLVYAAFVLLAFQLRIVLGEEPWLARRHGSDWDLYKSRVPRWLWHREYLQRNRSG